MKTILIVVITLFVSQSLYLHYGPGNPVARATSAAKGAVHDALEAAQKLVK